MGLFDLFKKNPLPSAARGTGSPATRFRLVHGKCPACGALAEMDIYDTLDASEDSPAFLRLLEARLNSAVCSCGQSISAVCPLLVHVPESGRVFFLAPGKMPECDQNAAADQLMHRLLARYQPPPSYLTNLDVVEVNDHEYEAFAAYILKNLQRPLI